MQKVIPHFEQFPLLSSKQKDFEFFKKICGMIDLKLHLKKDGFIKIIQLAYQMNSSGRRRRIQEEIIKSLY